MTGQTIVVDGGVTTAADVSFPSPRSCGERVMGEALLSAAATTR